MIEKTLSRQNSPLAEPLYQLKLIEQQGRDRFARFDETLSQRELPPLFAAGVEVLQVNVGKICNQTCHHCHVDAGPDRREMMSSDTIDECLAVLERYQIPTLDITGGAPEMNRHFRRLVSDGRRLGSKIIDRCNLTILLAPGYQDLPEFLASHHVHIVASLPCYLEENCDRQRGDGVFRKSIEALQRLNALGYGKPSGELELSLVYNPVGPSLPPSQSSLEASYRTHLRNQYGIDFTRLYTITNMPISRFLDELIQSQRYDAYMELLISAFNPTTVENVMCRTMISVDWRGYLYDCDFNQMLDLGVVPGVPRHIRDFDANILGIRPIVTGQHCYGCTAGTGSGCQGSLSERRVGR